MELNNVAEKLRKRGFGVQLFGSKEEAAAYINSQIDASTVGFGGSVTTQEMGLYESLSEHNTCHWHWNGGDYKDAAVADYYISSVNGMSEDGEMILIDGKGNRTSAVQFGHKKVFILVGKNKIAKTYEKAMWRARNIAAPKNAVRLNLQTPCRFTGKCMECSSPQRMCQFFLTIQHPNPMMPIEVVLIDEELGY